MPHSSVTIVDEVILANWVSMYSASYDFSTVPSENTRLLPTFGAMVISQSNIALWMRSPTSLHHYIVATPAAILETL